MTYVPGFGVGVDELAVELDLQSADVVLQHERHEPGVVVHADALARVGVAWLRRVADDLQVRIAARQHDVVEVVQRLAESQRERAQDREPDAVHRAHPREHRRLHRGQPCRPLVRAAQAPPRRIAGASDVAGSSAPTSSCSRQSLTPFVRSPPSTV